MTTLSYDAFGNVSQVRTPPNAAGQDQTLEISYDPVTHTYPARVTNGFGLTSTADYDFRFGVATRETDVNGVAMTRTLESLDRLVVMLERITDGHVIQRRWISAATGAPQSIETLVSLGQDAIWRGGSEANGDAERRDRHFLPYRRRL